MNIIIRKWGHSLGIRIPSVLVKEYNLKDGTRVDITEDNGKIIITPANNNLADLLKKITDSNIHDEISTGMPAGKEVW
jgi:antitoxin MazE